MGLLDNHVPQQHYQNTHPGNGRYNHYQFVSLVDIINQFIIGYVGEGKLISKADRMQVNFHAQRALAELSFDTFKSVKSLESYVTNSLVLPLPIDYVNYTKISCVDNAGIKKPLYPTLGKTSNPQKYQTDDDYEYLFDENGNFISSGELVKNGNFHGDSKPWVLNEHPTLGTTQAVTTSTATATAGDAESGWFYEKNSIRGYALPLNQAFRQGNIDIRSGEQYTITYTISNYVTGSYRLGIVDENGDYTTTTTRSANGTYTETITASANADITSPNYIFFQTTTDNSATSGLNVVIDNVSIVRVGDEETSTTWSNYKSNKPSENQQHDYDYDDHIFEANVGRRYGIDPQHAQDNGSYYIDDMRGLINFSSNISGKTVIIDYISDSLGTEEEMQVHKLAEEAMYKSIVYAILSLSLIHI